MKEEQKDFLRWVQMSKPRLYFQFVNANRKFYNRLCRDCQVRAFNDKGKLQLDDYCEACRIIAEDHQQQLKRIMEKMGAEVGE